MSRNNKHHGVTGNQSIDFLYSSIDHNHSSLSYLNIDSAIFESGKKTITPSKNAGVTYVSRRVNPYEPIQSLPKLKNNSVQTSLKQLSPQTEEFHQKSKKTLLTRLSYGMEQEDKEPSDYKYHHVKQRSFLKNLHSFKDVIAHLNAYPTTINVEITSPKASVINNKEYYLKSKSEKLNRWIDDQEYTFAVPQINSSTYSDRLSRQKEHLSLYLKNALSKFHQIIPYPTVSCLFDKIVTGLRVQHEKLLSMQELELSRIESLSNAKDAQLDDLQAKISLLQSQISGEQQYLDDLFVKVSKDAITKRIEEYQSSQSINEILQKNVPQVDNSDKYSGLNFYLNELYFKMNFESAVNQDQRPSNPLNFRSQSVIQGFKDDYLQKMKDVQNATAMRVLQRFYKNIEFAESSTQVEVDPVMVQLQEAKDQLGNIQIERAKEKEQQEELQKKIEVINASLSRLYQQLRESKAECQFNQDQLAQAESKLRSTEYEYRQTVDKVERYKDELRRISSELSEAKAIISFQNDQNSNLRISLSFSNDKIDQLEAENQQMEKQIHEFQQAKNAKKMPILIRKPIYNENREQIGEAFIEQDVSVDNQGDIDLFGENQQLNPTVLSQEDIEQFQQYCRESGINTIDKIQSLNDLKYQIKTQFTQLQGQELDDFMKQVQMVQRYFLRLQNEKNDFEVSFSAPSISQKQKSQKKQARRIKVDIVKDAKLQEIDDTISSKHLSSRLDQQQQETPPQVTNPILSDLVSSSHKMQINSNQILLTPPSIPQKVSTVNQGGQTSSSQMSNFVSYLQMTRNKLNNPDLPITQSVLKSRYYGGKPFVKNRIGIDLHTQTDGFNTTNFAEENHPLKQTLTQDRDCQTDAHQENPDDDLRRKLLEFIGGKLAKQGDAYDKGSALFTKASQMIEIMESFPKVKRVNGISPLKQNTYEPVLKK